MRSEKRIYARFLMDASWSGNAAAEKKQSNNNDMPFFGQFFPLRFRHGSRSRVEEKPVERENVNKNAIKGVNKRTFFVVFLSL